MKPVVGESRKKPWSDKMGGKFVNVCTITGECLITPCDECLLSDMETGDCALDCRNDTYMVEFYPDKISYHDRYSRGSLACALVEIKTNKGTIKKPDSIVAYTFLTENKEQK